MAIIIKTDEGHDAINTLKFAILYIGDVAK